MLTSIGNTLVYWSTFYGTPVSLYDSYASLLLPPGDVRIDVVNNRT